MSIKNDNRVETPFSLEKFKSFVNEYFTLIFVAVLLAGFSFWLGMLYKENDVLKSGGVVARPTAGAPVAGDDSFPSDPGGPSADQLAQAGLPSKDDYVRGSLDAKVVLVEYSDFECSFCARFHPTLKQVVEEYTNDVAWVYRHFPLGFHVNAQPAAEAVECVGKLGGNDKFWSYNDLLFENATNLSMDTYKRLATQVGVSADAVEKCINSGEMKQRVIDQMNAGQAGGISGTPGTIIFVDGEAQELIPGALPFDQVKQMVEKYL